MFFELKILDWTAFLYYHKCRKEFENMVLETLKEIIADAMGNRLKIEASNINESTEFIADLHADSVDIATIICKTFFALAILRLM